nr:hypothetical protein [Rhizobium leguminosarum]
MRGVLANTLRPSLTELAMEVAGGAAFHRENGLERCFRDIQGARYHPMQPGAQAQYAGSFALGLPTENIFELLAQRRTPRNRRLGGVV